MAADTNRSTVAKRHSDEAEDATANRRSVLYLTDKKRLPRGIRSAILRCIDHRFWPSSNKEADMRKGVGIAAVVLLAFPLAAGAQEAKVSSIDATAGSIVLDNGTSLTLGEQHLIDLQPGDKVQVSYEVVEGFRQLVLDRRVMAQGVEAASPAETTNLGSLARQPLEVQVSD